MQLKKLQFIFIILIITGSIYIIPTNSIEDNENPLTNNRSEVQTVIQEIESIFKPNDDNSQDSRLDIALEQYMHAGSIPEGIRLSQNKPNIVVTANSDINIEEIKMQMDVKVVIDLGIGFLFQGNVHSPKTLHSLLNMKEVGKIFGDYLINYDQGENSAPGPQIEQFRIREILGVDRVENELDINGEGVIVGVADSGVDFGVTDLGPAMARDDDGYPISFDPSGHGLALTNQTILADNNKLPISDINFDIWLSGGLVKFTDFFSQGDLEDLDITGIIPSKSGLYKVGILVEKGELTQFFICVLVDTTQAHDYDTLYIDFDTSWALTIKYNIEEEGGFLGRLLSGVLTGDYADFSLSDEDPHRWGDPIGQSEILARDLDDDGFADVSAGALANTLDYGKLFGSSEIIRGLHNHGNGFAVMWDNEGHGTSVAGNVAGQGIQPFTVYDDRLTNSVENDATFLLPGMARGSTIAATKALSGGSILLGWLWLCGFDQNPVTRIWEYTGEHKADIINNSFGDSDFELDGFGNSWDIDTLTVDLLSVPGIIDSLYPGTVFLVSAGNGGPGYGTVTSPASSTAAISIGASTSHHTEEDFYGPPIQGYDEVAPWSARGPSSLGTPKPDVVNIGNHGFSVIPLWATIGDGSKAYVEFGGTSQAAPLTAGVCALIIESLNQQGISWSPDMVKYILKSTTIDLGYEPVVQGSGRVDAYRAVQLAKGEDSSDGKPIFELFSPDTFDNSAMLLNDAFTTSFGEYDHHNVKLNIPTHPGITETFVDTSFFAGRVQPGGTASGTIIGRTASGGSLDEASTLVYELIREENYNLEATWAEQSKYKLEDYFSIEFMAQLASSEYVAIYLTYDQDTLEFYDDQEWPTPYVYLHDWDDINKNGLIDIKKETDDIGEVRRITASQNVANILSMYVGNPGSDFDNDPTISVFDDGFIERSSWEGIELSMTIKLYNRASWDWLSVTQGINKTEWIVNMNVPSTATPGIYQGYLKFMKGATEQLVPVTVSVVDKIPLGPNSLSFGGNPTSPLDPAGMYGSFDWSWRPESGDYRIYNFELTASEAKYLVTDVTWEYNGTMLDVWVVDPTGEVVDTSDIVPLRRGRFNSTSTRPTGQTIVTPVNKTGIYTIVLHNTQIDGRNIPEVLNISMSYLTEEFPTPKAEFSVPDEAELGGPHAQVSASWEQISSTQMPDLKITATSISSLEEEMINTTGTIDPNEDTLIGGWFENNGEIAEDYVTRPFKQGDIINIEVGWSAEDESTDMDIFVWGPGRDLTYDNNLVGSRLASNNNPEKTSFTVPRSGTYTIGLDWFEGSQIVDYYVFTYNSRGVTNIKQGLTATVDTHGVGRNGVFTIRAIALTGSSIQFQNEITVTAENFFPPEITVTYPNGGELITDLIDIQWTANDRNLDETLRFNVYYSPNNGESWTRLRDENRRYYVEGTTQLNQDFSRWRGYDQGLIKVEASDGLFTVEDISDGTFSISTEFNEFNKLAIFLIVPLLVLPFLMRKRKKS